MSKKEEENYLKNRYENSGATKIIKDKSIGALGILVHGSLRVFSTQKNTNEDKVDANSRIINDEVAKVIKKEVKVDVDPS